MLPALLLAAVAPARWFGPATVSFPIEFAGNPYDPEINDVRVRFTDEKGDTTERIAYYDNGAFRAVLVADRPGRWSATLYRNGVKVQQTNPEGTVEAREPLPHGYLRVDPILKTRFTYDDGTSYVPLGLNQAWGDGKPETTISAIQRMHDAGLNWARIWSASWEGKNPWFPSNQQVATPGELWPPALDFWHQEIAGISKTKVAFQFVLHNHGSFSSMVDPNWNDNPWNAARGGFLKDPIEFFTDPEAKRRTRMWLRYAVARYSWSPNILAWELFNEVENTNAGRTGKWAEIGAWHAEMAAYIRSIDPYRHLVTTSSAMEHPELYAAMDFVQPHTYPASVLAAVMSVKPSEDKPVFFGEFGPPGNNDESTREGVRDGVYGGLFARHAGAAQYWYWDRAEKNGVFAELALASKVIAASGWAEHPRAHAADIRVKSDLRTDLVLAPGGGWQATTLETLNLPDDATPEKLAQISAYFQSEVGDHRDMGKPLRLRFTSPAAALVEFRFGEASKTGGHITIRVNDAVVTDRDISAATVITIPIPVGSVRLDVNNTGSDWVRLERVTIPKIAPGAQAWQLFEGNWGMLRVKARTVPADVTLGGIQLPNGTYRLRTIDVITGKEATSTVTLTNGELPYSATAADTILILTGSA